MELEDTDLDDELQSLFSADKITVMTLGHPLRGDDGVGPYIGAQLVVRDPNRFQLINAQTTPTNFLGPILEFRPSTLIIIDATDIGEPPGTLIVFDQEDEQTKQTATTHYQGVSTLMEFIHLEAAYQPEVYFICIQIETIEINPNLSSRIQLKADQLISLLNKHLD